MLHWEFFAALVIACLVFDAWVFKVARKRGYREGYAAGAFNYSPPHEFLQAGDTTYCKHCPTSFDTNDDPDVLPPCSRHYSPPAETGDPNL